jgi:hypothetical protein
MSSKYWVANNPNSEITDAKAQKISELSATNISLAELEKSADASVIAPVAYTATAAIAENVRCIKLAHNSTPVEITGPSGVALAGQIMHINNTSASGTAAHTVTLSAGTFDGTNNKATLNAPAESLTVWFDSGGTGCIILNAGSVSLSSV